MVNWHFLLSDERKLCFKKIDKSICLFEKKFQYRNFTWKKQSEFAFVLCPEGAGVDTHRIWEAILLGCIPILKKNGISNLFSKLPIIIVNNWNEININYLKDEYEKIINKKFDFSSLFLKYWKLKFANDETKFELEKMTLDEFKNYVQNNLIN